MVTPRIAIDASTHVIIKGARVHNLKNIDVNIPKNQLVVITGLSGSGKSSLAFDTLYAEGQRRYIESLSAYARQFLGKMNKPDVDIIQGIAPCIAIEQKVNTSNPRSTVGTSTEIYDYLKLLFARIGKTYSPISGKEVKKNSVTDVVNFILTFPDDTSLLILCPLLLDNGRTLEEECNIWLQKGFTRIVLDNKILRIEEWLSETKSNKRKNSTKNIFIVIDRVRTNQDEDTVARLSDSVQIAFLEGNGDCYLEAENRMEHFCNRFELDNISFENPSVNLFSFNNPYGACKTCEGHGNVIGIDEDLVVPDKKRSVFDDAIAPWRGINLGKWKKDFISASAKHKFPIHRPYAELDVQQKSLLWKGTKDIAGLDNFFDFLQKQTYQVQYRVILSRYRGKTACPDCRGSRLRKDANYVKINQLSITDMVLMPIENLLQWFTDVVLSEHDQQIAQRLLLEIINRLTYLSNVGLNYLTLNRLSNTLSGGESQRINLATSLGSSLVGSIYVLDEPSIGLHPRDTRRLIGILESLKEAGNTVIVVEHEEEIMRAADHIIDIGPLAGSHGGELVCAGTFNEIINNEESLTAQYLSNKRSIPTPKQRRPWSSYLEIQGARENNLKNINVKFPLHTLTVVSGVSGSGKTSLIKKILVPALQKQIGAISREETGKFDLLTGDISTIEKVEMVDQNPIGRSSRSNPVSYIKAWDDIRDLFAKLPASKALGLKPGYFSFNVEGGRCDICEGEGEVKISMQFMADIYLPCESCGGKRFKQQILDITYKEKNVANILELTVDEAILFFETDNTIFDKIKVLSDVGLGYIKLGQSSNTLSGGEAQRVKLASFLLKGAHPQKTLFVFDEPTTGLHFHDIQKLLQSFQSLITKGASIIVVEHNLDIIKTADWIIDLGPEGGEQGGNLLFSGTPDDFITQSDSYTAQALKHRIMIQ